MSVFTTAATITVTCHNRLAPYLEAEIRELGFRIDSSFATGVKLTGTLNDCIRLNLNLRCASQVLYFLEGFEARNADELYEHLSRYPWETLIPREGYFSVRSNVFQETINNSMFASLKVKDAIVDRMKERTGIRPDTGSEYSGAVFNLFWKHELAEIHIDTSGASLGRHGYRKFPGSAPMLEALAAAVVLATAWDKRSPLVNPMCGSGTLAIEAALIATNARPGLFRTNYSFMHLTGYDEEVYHQEMDRLDEQILEVPGLQIIASDHSEVAVNTARKNAIAAGVKDLIRFEQCDFTRTTVPATDSGILLLNPEYGERLGDETELEKTYAAIGDFMKQKCSGYMGYIFTGNLGLSKKIGLKSKRRIEFFNGKIDCRLVEFELYGGTKRVSTAGEQ